MDENTIRNILRQELEPIRSELTSLRMRIDGLPLIGGAIDILQRDVRLVRAAINDMGRTNITAGEVEAMHTDIDRVLTTIRDLAARVTTLEERKWPK